MVSISSSVQAGEASQEKPMQEIAPESMSATEGHDILDVGNSCKQNKFEPMPG